MEFEFAQLVEDALTRSQGRAKRDPHGGQERWEQKAIAMYTDRV